MLGRDNTGRSAKFREKYTLKSEKRFYDKYIGKIKVIKVKFAN